MTLVTGTVKDIGYAPMDGTLYARPARFRPDGAVVYAPERTPYKIESGAFSIDLAPGPAVVELKVGTHAREEFRVVIPDQASVTLSALIEEVFPWQPEQVSQFVAERKAAQRAKTDAEAAAALADQRKSEAELAAQQTGQDVSHVDQSADHVDTVAQTVAAALEQANTFVQDQVPPYLQQTELNDTYGTKAELAEKADAAMVGDLTADKLDKAEAAATYATNAALSEVATGQEVALTGTTVAGVLQTEGNPARLAVENLIVAFQPRPPELLRTNLATRPVPTSTTEGWLAARSGHTAALDTTVVRRAGSTSSRIDRAATPADAYIGQWNYTGQVSASPLGGIPVTPGVEVSASVYVRSSIPARGRLTFTYYDTSGSPITSPSSAYVDLPASEWVRLPHADTPVAGAAKMQVVTVVAMPTGSSTSGGEQAWAQDCLIEYGPLGDYFDGTFPDDLNREHTWTGTANASTSELWRPGVGEPDTPVLEWALAGAYDVTAVSATDTSTGLPTTATLAWPDGSGGTFTGTVNTAHAAYDSYTLTHATSGRTVTQALVTRGPDGTVTAKPALTITGA